MLFLGINSATNSRQVQNGEKEIPVGRTIAVIAEQDDDISSLTLPEPVTGGVTSSAPKAEESKPAESKEEPKKEAATPAATTPAKETSKEESAPASASISVKADPKQVLFPSVLNLAHQNNLTAEQVLTSVPASGPKGRVTKGDILAYLGKVPQSNIDTLVSVINKREHLDLSNIKAKVAEPEAAPAADAATESSKAPEQEKQVAKAPPAPVVLKGLFTLAELETLQISLDDSIGTTPSIKQLVEKASKLALRDVPAFTKAKKSIFNDPLFDALVAPSNKGLKPFDVQITYPSVPKKTPSYTKRDIFDELTSKRASSASVSVSDALSVAVTVNPKYVGGEKKAQVYLDRLSFYLSSGRGDLLL